MGPRGPKVLHVLNSSPSEKEKKNGFQQVLKIVVCTGLFVMWIHLLYLSGLNMMEGMGGSKQIYLCG